MKVISILNHKGGVGKSTIATNLAGYYANHNHKVLLGDFDVQQSSQNWLSLRPENVAPIETWNIQNGKMVPPPNDTSHIIVDSPAGVEAHTLERLVSISDKIITPLRPSMFDILTTKVFLEDLIEIINKQNKKTDLCVIGNMVDIRTKSAENLMKFTQSIGLDTPIFIRQAQIYVHLIAHGLSIFDSKTTLFERDLQQWQPLLEWLEK